MKLRKVTFESLLFAFDGLMDYVWNFAMRFWALTFWVVVLGVVAIIFVFAARYSLTGLVTDLKNL